LWLLGRWRSSLSRRRRRRDGEARAPADEREADLEGAYWRMVDDLQEIAKRAPKRGRARRSDQEPT
jgi:hypothetical protein